MRSGFRVWGASLLAIVAMVGAAVTAEAGAFKLHSDSLRRQCQTCGEGTVRYEDSGTTRRMRIQLTEVKADANTSVTVYIDHEAVGSVQLGAAGDGKLDLDTSKGNVVPAAHDGSVVEVKAGAGELVLLGHLFGDRRGVFP